MSEHRVAVIALKTVHTLIFAGELTAITWLLVSGLIGRRDRSVGIAAAAVAVEAVVFIGNDGICPITPMTERLGATHGSVSDIFLPAAVARTIPVWSTALLVVAGLLHARALLRGRTQSPPAATFDALAERARLPQLTRRRS
jgi:hypothetical protein